MLAKISLSLTVIEKVKQHTGRICAYRPTRHGSETRWRTGPVIPRLHGRANIEQTPSKCIQNKRAIAR